MALKSDGEQIAVVYPATGNNVLSVHHTPGRFTVRLGAHKTVIPQREFEEVAYKILARCRPLDG
jgi:hypothetical protein